MQNGSLRLASIPAQSLCETHHRALNVMPSGCSLTHADFPFSSLFSSKRRDVGSTFVSKSVTNVTGFRYLQT
jgi:hypothetical protein